MSTPLKWTRIKGELPRSSHSICLIGNKVYIYGGEITPREPVDGDVHVVDITTGKYERVHGKGDVPEPRVGHVAGVINGNIYVFGGRGGPSMTPLEEAGAVYRFSPSTSTWTKLTPSSATYPCARSYHAATTTSSGLIVHAGCGDASTGRLRDTWAFDVASQVWTQLADAPGDGRGGTSIAFLDNKLFRFGGFNGKTEIGGSIDSLDLNQTGDGDGEGWQTRPFGQAAGLGREDIDGLISEGEVPGARSVHALLPIAGKLVTLFGEGKPSHTGGHDAAGNFWDDVWMYETTSGVWEQSVTTGLKPTARGWFAGTGDGSRIVVWGGLNAKNERLSDGWILSTQ